MGEGTRRGKYERSPETRAKNAEATRQKWAAGVYKGRVGPLPCKPGCTCGLHAPRADRSKARPKCQPECQCGKHNRRLLHNYRIHEGMTIYRLHHPPANRQPALTPVPPILAAEGIRTVDELGNVNIGKRRIVTQK